MKLVYLGTPEFVVSPLATLLDAGHEVVAVVTPEPRPAGRRRRLVEPPLAVAARELGLTVLQSAKVSVRPFRERLMELGPEVAVTAAFGQYLWTKFLASFPHGVLNIHPSLLPRYRGASPVVSFLLSDDETTGVTILRSVKQMDAGPILAQREVSPEPGETAGELTERLFEVGGVLLAEVLRDMEAGRRLRERPQDDDQATTCTKVDKDMARIDWTAAGRRVVRSILAFNPRPGAWTTIQGRQLKVWRAVEHDDRASHGPGTLTVEGKKGPVLVDCGDGTRVRLLEAQIQGSKRMAAEDLVRGLRLPGPVVLGGRP